MTGRLRAADTFQAGGDYPLVAINLTTESVPLSSGYANVDMIAR
ncbi:MAG TPA: hypothetical protein VK196_12365 [Magnetospirillum sp.]|nr:hypothetical protein [Magnetospirillum sp.]